LHAQLVLARQRRPVLPVDRGDRSEVRQPADHGLPRESRRQARRDRDGVTTMPLPSFSKSMWLAAAALGVSLASCRGDLSAKPPVHLVLDMDFQPKLRAQDDAQIAGWADGRSMRAPVADPSGRTLVVARDTLGDPKLSPRTANNAFVTQNPLPVSADVLARGRYLFDINCAVCHGYSGMGGNHPE